MTLELIKSWHGDMLRRPFDANPVRLVMGFPVWGEPYTSIFMKYALPSILASPNLEAFRTYGGASIHIWSPEPLDIPVSWPGPLTYHWNPIPHAIMEALKQNPMLKYPLLTAVHNYLIHRAGQWNAGFHMGTADGVYSIDYFKNLLYLAQYFDGIVHSGFNSIINQAVPLLERYRTDYGTLSVPAPVLGQIGLDHIVPQYDWCMDDVDEDLSMMPQGHLIYWRGRDHARIHSPHLNVSWISPVQCRRVTQPLGGTLDSELPRYVGAPFYSPQLSDNMVMMPLAGNESERMPIVRMPRDQWRQHFLDLIDRRPEYLPYFKTPCVVPLDRFDESKPSNTELDRRMAKLMEVIAL